MRVAGVVLAGGRSSRMGRTKALVEVDGRAMANRVIDAVRSAGCEPVVVFGGDPTELASLDAPVLVDVHPDEGPVGGLVGALSWLRDGSEDAEVALVVACDLAYLGPEALQPLFAVASTWPEGVDVVVARSDRVEPMCAIWRTSAIDAVDAAFRSGTRSLHGLLDALEVVEVDVPGAGLANLNTPDDLALLSGRDSVAHRGRRPAGGLSSAVVSIEEISVTDLHALGSDIRLIDVREDDEWADGHVAHAIHVPLGTVPDHLDRFDGSPTYVLCKAGGRGMRACEFADANGHEVVNVTGGMMAWEASGYDVVTGTAGDTDA